MMTIVTGASSNHFKCLCHLLYTLGIYEPHSRIVVYDLGLSSQENAHLRTFKGLNFRKFNFARHPEWMGLKASGDKGERSGQYAWKPIIVHDTLVEFGGMVLWLDAGDLIQGPLDHLRQVLQQEGLYSPTSSGNIGKWTHPKTLEYMKVSKELLAKNNRNGAAVGFNTASIAACKIARTWKQYALKKECIAPVGASHDNHRYDQAILSILLYQFQDKYSYDLVNGRLNISMHNDGLSFEKIKKKILSDSPTHIIQRISRVEPRKMQTKIETSIITRLRKNMLIERPQGHFSTRMRNVFRIQSRNQWRIMLKNLLDELRKSQERTKNSITRQRQDSSSNQTKVRNIVCTKSSKGQRIMLEHLITEPRGGLCNRLRVVAAAKRLCTINQIRCTILWKWGDYDALLQADPAMDWIAEVPSPIEDRYTRIRHLLAKEGGSYKERRVWLTKDTGIILTTWFAFNAFEEPGPIKQTDLGPWLPMPSELILNKVRDFKQAYFKNTVGMHMRRTDKAQAIIEAPDELYFQEAAKLIDSGHTIFLATDNRETEKMMCNKYGNKIIVYPKNPELVKRWPRKGFNFAETVDDLVDLHLLASCEFVIGARASTYSVFASMYNGSPDCQLFKLKMIPHELHTPVRDIPALFDGVKESIGYAGGGNLITQ
jgi:Protein of unknown function (DUF1647)